MKLTLIADGSTKWQRFIRRWGVSYLFDGDVLLDAFGDSSVFLNNLAWMQVDTSKIRHVVISHDHWDHLAGLWPFLEKNRDVTVYICPGFGKETKEKLAATGTAVVEINAPTEIRAGIYTTGPLPGIFNNESIEEQAIVVKTGHGLALVTGCAHPGITHIIDKVVKDFGQAVFLVTGGLHLNNASREEIKGVSLKLREAGVKKVVPLHCTGKKAQQIFRNIFGEDGVRMKEGNILILDK